MNFKQTLQFFFSLFIIGGTGMYLVHANMTDQIVVSIYLLATVGIAACGNFETLKLNGNVFYMYIMFPPVLGILLGLLSKQLGNSADAKLLSYMLLYAILLAIITYRHYRMWLRQ